MPKPILVKDKKLEKEIHDLASAERNLEVELAREIKVLSKEIRRMKDMEVIQIFKQPWRFMGFCLLKGILIGFGSVLGATIFLSLFVYLLAQISLVPIVGDFVKDVIETIENPTVIESPINEQTIIDQYHQAQEEIQNSQGL